MNRTDQLLAIVLELHARGQQRTEDLAATFAVSKWMFQTCPNSWTAVRFKDASPKAKLIWNGALGNAFLPL